MILKKKSSKKYEGTINISGVPVTLRIIKKNPDDPIKLPRKIRNILLSNGGLKGKRGDKKNIFFKIGKCLFPNHSLI